MVTRREKAAERPALRKGVRTSAHRLWFIRVYVLKSPVARSSAYWDWRYMFRGRRLSDCLLSGRTAYVSIDRNTSTPCTVKPRQLPFSHP